MAKFLAALILSFLLLNFQFEFFLRCFDFVNNLKKIKIKKLFEKYQENTISYLFNRKSSRINTVEIFCSTPKDH